MQSIEDTCRTKALQIIALCPKNRSSNQIMLRLLKNWPYRLNSYVLEPAGFQPAGLQIAFSASWMSPSEMA